MRTRSVSTLSAALITVAAVIAAVAPAPAAAATHRLPTGSTRYVRIVHVAGGGLSVALTPLGRAALKGRLRGEVLSATCTTLGLDAHGLQTSSETGASTGGTSGGHATYITLLDRHADFCDVSLVHLARDGSVGQPNGPPFASLALDQRGARFLDEDRVTLMMYSVLTVAMELSIKDPHQNFPAAARVAGLIGGHAVVLASPRATPPVGVIGVYSNRRNRLEVVGRSTLGRRLFIAYSGAVLSTNVSEHLFRLTSGQAATAGA